MSPEPAPITTPCRCPLIQAGVIDPHTLADHKANVCRGYLDGQHCGTCWNCWTDTDPAALDSLAPRGRPDVTRHAVYLDPDEKPGYVRARCRTCRWAGTLTEAMADADGEGDRHETDPTGSTLWDGTGPYPDAPRAAITIQAARILGQLVEGQPTRLRTVSDGIAAVALARRGLAVKVGAGGWQRTRRGTAWAQKGRTR